MIGKIISAIGSVIDGVIKFASNIGGVWAAILAFVIGVVIAPIHWAYAMFLDILQAASGLVDKILVILEKLQINQISANWGGALYYIGIADNFIPIALVIYVLTGLFALWVLTAKIRFFLWMASKLKSLIPFMGS